MQQLCSLNDLTFHLVYSIATIYTTNCRFRNFNDLGLVLVARNLKTGQYNPLSVLHFNHREFKFKRKYKLTELLPFGMDTRCVLFYHLSSTGLFC